MSLIGKEATKLAKSLNERDFVLLCRDLLSSKGHLNIRIMDGPGDGGRDIHSVTSENKKFLTQCKYHQNPTSTCSSKDISELPMASFKFGYKSGLFITNARISPQGKKEYIDNYPNLDLDFLDGEALIAEILENPLLRVIWLKEDCKLARINTSVVIPIIIRRHVDDASILPLGCDEPLNTNDSLNEFFQKYPEYTFRIESSSSDTEAFEPYRLPEPITSEEGLLPFIKITQVLISGDIPLDQISIIQNDLCKSFLAWCETRWQGLTIKAGRPSIIPLEGEKSGSRIELPFKSVTYLSTQNSSGAELDWFFPKEIVGWSKSCDANVSESVWVRLFNSDLNCCLAYEVNGRISYHNKILKWAMREMTHEGWMKSIFCLIPKWEKWPYENIALPDETAIWPWDGRVLCGWFHWNLLGYPKAPRTVNTQHRFFQAPSEDEEKSRLNSIKQLLESIDIIEFVEPKIARHMVAIIGNDPLSEDDFMIYDTANILSSPETIPSPIAPNSRRFRVTICWTGNTDHQKIKKVFNSIIPEINLSGVCQIITYVDNDFIVADLEFKFDEILIKPSSILINDITLFLTKLLSIFDKRMNYSLKRSTKLYWEKRYNVKLGVEWYDSDKVYMWRRNEQGEIIPVRVTPEELEKD